MPNVNSTEPAYQEWAAGLDLDWAAALWRRKWIVVVVALFAAGLGYLYFLQLPPRYESTAQVLLVKREVQLPVSQVEAPNSPEDTISTHIMLIKSQMILQQAVDKYHLKDLPSFRGLADPVSVISSGLTVTRAGNRDIPNPNVIDLRYEGRTDQETLAVLTAITGAYQSFLSETYQSVSSETVRLIELARQELSKQLDERQRAYYEHRQREPILRAGAEGQTVHEARMAEFEAARSEVIVENARLDAEIEALEDALKRNAPREVLALLMGDDGFLPSSSRPIETADELLFEVELEEKLLLEKLGPQHPKVRQIRSKLKLMRDYFDRRRNSTVSEATHVDLGQVYLESLKHRRAQGKQKLAKFDELFEQESEAAKKMAEHLIKEEQLRSEMERTQQLFDGVVKRLEEMEMMKDAGGLSASLITPPALGRPVQRSLTVIQLIAVVVGSLLGLALAALVEVADKSFRSPEDIERQLAAPIIGHIPLVKTKPLIESLSRMDPSLHAFHQPKSRISEAYRAVRTALYFSTRGKLHKLIQVTSPDPGDGKSTLAANLAISIAQSGKRVLLIDADFRRPRIHDLFGLDRNVGISSVISDRAQITDAIQATEVAHLWCLPCGPRPHNPSELLSSPRFEQLLQVLREKYDFVLIDTPPLLAVTDPSVVAARVDGVLLTLRISAKARQHAARSMEMLRTVEANVLGVAVNALGGRPGYGYGSYHYESYQDQYVYSADKDRNGNGTYEPLADTPSTLSNGSHLREGARSDL